MKNKKNKKKKSEAGGIKEVLEQEREEIEILKDKNLIVEIIKEAQEKDEEMVGIMLNARGLKRESANLLLEEWEENTSD